jgi:hypothetical protein
MTASTPGLASRTRPPVVWRKPQFRRAAEACGSASAAKARLDLSTGEIYAPIRRVGSSCSIE